MAAHTPRRTALKCEPLRTVRGEPLALSRKTEAYCPLCREGQSRPGYCRPAGVPTEEQSAPHAHSAPERPQSQARPHPCPPAPLIPLPVLSPRSTAAPTAHLHLREPLLGASERFMGLGRWPACSKCGPHSSSVTFPENSQKSRVWGPTHLLHLRTPGGPRGPQQYLGPDPRMPSSNHSRLDSDSLASKSACPCANYLNFLCLSSLI